MAVGEWPKRSRKVLIPCSLCDTPTSDNKGVCRNCRIQFEAGKKALEALDLGEKRAYYIPQYSFSHSWRKQGESVLNSKTFYLLDALEGMMGIPAEAFSYLPTEDKPGGAVYPARPYVPESRERWVNPDIILYRRNGTQHDAPYAKLMLTQRQAEAIKELCAAIDEMINNAHQDGYNSGSSMLVRLAEGELTIDDLNRRLNSRG